MPRSLAPHGTVAAYKRHLRHHEEPCVPCRDAKRDARRAEYLASRGRKGESADAETTSPPVSPDDLGDLELIAQTLRASMLKVAKESPEKVAPIARELRATLVALGAGSEKPKEASLADQLAEARAARAARATS
jgi:hypothetical protein